MSLNLSQSPQLSNQSSKLAKRFDRWGIFIAGACMAHCIATPLVLLFVAGGLGWMSHESAIWGNIDLICALLAPFVACIPMYQAWKRGYKKSLALFIIGFAFLVAGMLMPHHSCGLHDIHSVTHLILMLLGAVCIISAHTANILDNKKATNCC